MAIWHLPKSIIKVVYDRAHWIKLISQFIRDHLKNEEKKKLEISQNQFDCEEKLRLMCKIQPLINDPLWTTLPLANVKFQPRLNLVYCLIKFIFKICFGLFKSMT